MKLFESLGAESMNEMINAVSRERIGVSVRVHSAQSKMIKIEPSAGPMIEAGSVTKTTSSKFDKQTIEASTEVTSVRKPSVREFVDVHQHQTLSKSTEEKITPSESPTAKKSFWSKLSTPSKAEAPSKETEKTGSREQVSVSVTDESVKNDENSQVKLDVTEASSVPQRVAIGVEPERVVSKPPKALGSQSPISLSLESSQQSVTYSSSSYSRKSSLKKSEDSIAHSSNKKNSDSNIYRSHSSSSNSSSKRHIISGGKQSDKTHSRSRSASNSKDSQKSSGSASSSSYILKHESSNSLPPITGNTKISGLGSESTSIAYKSGFARHSRTASSASVSSVVSMPGINSHKRSGSNSIQSSESVTPRGTVADPDSLESLAEPKASTGKPADKSSAVSLDSDRDTSSSSMKIDFEEEDDLEASISIGGGESATSLSVTRSRTSESSPSLDKKGASQTSMSKASSQSFSGSEEGSASGRASGTESSNGQTTSTSYFSSYISGSNSVASESEGHSSAYMKSSSSGSRGQQTRAIPEEEDEDDLELEELED